MSAAQIALKLALAEQEESQSALNYSSAGLNAIKAFFGRTVKLPAVNPCTSCKRLLEVQRQLESLASQKVCHRKVTLHEIPDDWSWSKGKAKLLTKHVVVRQWNTPGVKNSGMHTTLTLEDKNQKRKDHIAWYFLLSSNCHEWNKSGNKIKRKIAPVLDAINSFIGRFKPSPAETYAEDKEIMLGNASWKLTQGAYARRAISEGKTSPELIRQAKVRPLSYQKKSSKDGEWQRRAEKVYLPAIGKNHDLATGMPKFLLFGLQLEKMQKTWMDIKDKNNPRHYYRQLSTSQNCSGMSLSILKSGGSDLFCKINPKIYTSPDQVDRYSKQLMHRIESLNDQSDAVSRRFEQKKNQLTPYSHEAAIDRFDDLLKGSLTRKLKQHIRKLKAMTVELSTAQDSFDQLIPLAIKIVEEINQAYQVAGGNPKAEQSLDPALSVFMSLRAKMMKASEEQGDDQDMKPPFSDSEPDEQFSFS